MFFVETPTINGKPTQYGLVPPILSPGSGTCQVTIANPSATPQVPFPTGVTGQIMLDTTPISVSFPIASLVAQTIPVTIPSTSGVFPLYVQLTNAPKTVMQPSYLAQVIITESQNPTRIPVLNNWQGQLSYRRDGNKYDWVTVADLHPPVSLPITLQPALPWTTRLPKTSLYVDHLQPIAAMYGQATLRLVQDKLGNKFVAPCYSEATDSWFEQAALYVDRQVNVDDSERGISFISSYSQGTVLPDGSLLYVIQGKNRGFVGRLHVGTDPNYPAGFVECLGHCCLLDPIGIPYNPNDTTIPDSLRNTMYEDQGNTDVPLSMPMDICFDPRDPYHYAYIADAGNHRIVQVDMQMKCLSTYAGMPTMSGYADGTWDQARFNTPTSVCMTSDGFLYVTDYKNHVIRQIDPVTRDVTTVCGSQRTLQDAKTMMTKETGPSCRTKYQTAGDALTQSKLVYPMCIRKLNDDEDLCIMEPHAGTLRYWGRDDGTTSIVYTNDALIRNNQWTWMDIDHQGVCGPVNDILVSASVGFGNVMFARVYNDYSGYETVFPSDGMATPGRVATHKPPHYPWLIAVGGTPAVTGRIYCNGYGTDGMVSIRQAVASDPLAYTSAQTSTYGWGFKLWLQGATDSDPSYTSNVPGFNLLHGIYGINGLLGGFVELEGKTDAEKAQMLRDGWGSTSGPRTISDPDMVKLLYFVNSHLNRLH